MAENGRRFLIDTSIWLELLLEQDRADDSADLLQRVPMGRVRLTEFTFYSIGLKLTRQGRPGHFRAFVERNFVERSLRRVRLTGDEMLHVPDVMEEFDLDFDDGYQYVAATLRELRLVSFDTDFDRTDLERLEPQEIGG